MQKGLRAAFRRGDAGNFVEMMNNARALATKRMVEEAQSLGADAIAGVRYASTSVMQSAAEVMAYGTAVRVEQELVYFNTEKSTYP